MVSTGPTARIPAEAPKHADAPSGARGNRAEANRVRRASFSFALRELFCSFCHILCNTLLALDPAQSRDTRRRNPGGRRSSEFGPCAPGSRAGRGRGEPRGDESSRAERGDTALDPALLLHRSPSLPHTGDVARGSLPEYGAGGSGPAARPVSLQHRAIGGPRFWGRGPPHRSLPWRPSAVGELAAIPRHGLDPRPRCVQPGHHGRARTRLAILFFTTFRAC